MNVYALAVWNVETPETIKPLLAVINPTESIFVTSSYVNVPPTEIFPDTVRVPPTLTFVLIATLTALRFKLFGLVIGWWKSMHAYGTVSYTHLTLPTICSV